MSNKSEETTVSAEPKICFSYIRLSSVRQSEEDRSGEDRQMKIAPLVAQEMGWVLDETLNIADLMSGFHGANAEDGELGTLLAALKAGRIPKGRIMIIESFDRLSRMNLKKARRLFEDLIDAGMDIYVHEDRKLYTEASLDDLGDIMLSLLKMKAAHDYSARLSERIKGAWVKKKRQFIETGKAYKYKCPGWLKWNDTTKTYEPIPEKVKSIERIFQLANAGHGVRTIVRILNKEGVERIANYNGKKLKSTKWANVVVNRMLNTKEVLGFPKAIDPPVKMFPAVIDEKIYYSAKAKMDDRRTHKYYGRTQEAENLFVGLAKCSCGKAMCMHKINRESAKRNPNFGARGGIGARGGKPVHTYLWCSGFVDGTCSSKQIRYDLMEESFGVFLTPDFAMQFMDRQETRSNDADILAGKLADTRKRLEQYGKDYAETPSKMLATMMANMEEQEKQLMREIEHETMITIGSTPINDAWKDFNELLNQDWELPEFRLKVRETIRTIVEKIVIDIPTKSYQVFFKGHLDEPVKVEVFRQGCWVTPHNGERKWFDFAENFDASPPHKLIAV